MQEDPREVYSTVSVILVGLDVLDVWGLAVEGDALLAVVVTSETSITVDLAVFEGLLARDDNLLVFIVADSGVESTLPGLTVLATSTVLIVGEPAFTVVVTSAISFTAAPDIFDGLTGRDERRYSLNEAESSCFDTWRLGDSSVSFGEELRRFSAAFLMTVDVL